MSKSKFKINLPTPLGDEVEKKGKFRRSGHLTDQMLKYNYPKDRQPSLFDNLQSKTLKDIEVAGVEVAQIVEGIKLSPSETKVIDCLCSFSTSSPKGVGKFILNLLLLIVQLF